MIINTKPLSGFLELLPGDQIEFDRMKNIIEKTYQEFGFTSLDTPIIERSEVILAKGGAETDSQIYFAYNANSTEQKAMALRFDLTVPLARYVAQYTNDLAFPFRRMHIGKVYRGERAQKGRFREFYQCDIDVIGKNNLSVFYDGEIPAIIYQVFKRLNIGKFKIKISNRKIFNGFFEALEITSSFKEIMHIIDKSQKISKSELETELKALLNESQITALFDFMEITGSVEFVLSKLKDLDINHTLFKEGLNELEIVTDTMRALNVPDDYFEIDLSIVRGLDYYTGTVYETIMENSKIGSVCSGGRYEDLASHYTKEKLPGVGISIGLSRLFAQLKEFGLISAEQKTLADVIVVPQEERDFNAAIYCANILREQSIKVDLFLEDIALKKKMSYITKMNTPYVVMVKTADTRQVYSLQYKSAGEIVKKELSPEEIGGVINEIGNK